MYSQYRAVDAAACLVLPDGATAKDGASSFVNPLTALGMLETMRREGHSGLVHTAAASNLGQMLVKLCLQGRGAAGQHRPQARAGGAAARARRESRLQLGVAVVLDRPRRGAQGDLRDARLRRHRRRNAGRARSSTAWRRRPTRPPRSTRVTGRPSTSRCTSTADSTPGRPSSTRNFGMAWGVGGWLLTPFLQGAGAETIGRLRARVAAELTTTFASSLHPARCHLRACSPPTRSTPTSSGRRGRSSSSLRTPCPDITRRSTLYCLGASDGI